MANKKITDLTAATALTGVELFETVQGGVSKKATAQQEFAFVQSQLALQGLTVGNDGGSFGYGLSITDNPASIQLGLRFVMGGVTSAHCRSDINGNISFSSAISGGTIFFGYDDFAIGTQQAFFAGAATFDGNVTGNGNIDAGSFSSNGNPGIDASITVLTELPSTFQTLNFSRGILISIT